MAKQKVTIITSDLSGEQLENGTAAKVAITIGKDRWELDAARSEVESLIAAGRKGTKRGRKAQTA